MTITKLSTPFLLAAALLFTSACDPESEELDAERSAELDKVDDGQDAEAPDDVRRHRRGKRAHKDPAERLCAKLECSDEQATQISELFAKHRDARKGDEGEREARKAARDEAQGKLAAAFRADDFDASVLGELHQKRDPEAHLDAAVRFMAELHGILTPEQREQLAAKIEKRGPMFLHHGGKHRGHRGHHKKHRGHEGEGPHAGGPTEVDGPKGERPSPEQRVAKHVERFCEPISCTEEQQGQLAAIMTDAHEQRREHREARKAAKPDFSPVAEAFKAESFDEQAVRSALADAKPDMSERHEGFATVIAEVHDILTPEQRAVLADKIEAEGLHAVLGKGHRGHEGRKGKRRHRRGPHGADKDVAAE